MGQFRKKPVVIDAVQVRSQVGFAKSDWKGLEPWLSEAYEKGGIVFLYDGISIKTLEGTMIGGMDDWIIKGVKGELYPCKHDIFQATYEPYDSRKDDKATASA